MKTMMKIMLMVIICIISINGISILSEAATWTQAHQYYTYADSDNSTVYNWTQAQQFYTNADSQTDYWEEAHNYTNEAYSGTGSGPSASSSINWMFMLIWLMIIWIPAFLVNSFAPGIGLAGGVVAMGIVVLLVDITFIVPFVAIFIGAICIALREA